MTALDLTRLKELAQAAGGREWADTGTAIVEVIGADFEPNVWWHDFEGDTKPEHRAHVAAANPAVVLELVARLERAEKDANRWRAFVGSARIKPQGSAGLGEPQPDHYAHMGLEIWTTFDRDCSQKLLDQVDASTALGREWLTKYADIAVAAMAARTMPNDPLDDVLPLTGECTREKMHADVAERITSTPEARQFAEIMAKQMKEDLEDLFVATSPMWETPEAMQAALNDLREQRRQAGQPKILPDNMPASLDLDDKENGDVQ